MSYHPRYLTRGYRRMQLSLPNETWSQIIGYLSQADQLNCLLVSKKFRSIALRFDLKLVKLHLNASYFDGSGTRRGGPHPSRVQVYDTTQQNTALLHSLFSSYDLQRRIKGLVVFTRDSLDTNHFRLAFDVITRCPQLREFHLVVTEWGNNNTPLMARPIHTFVTTVLARHRLLHTLTLPTRFAKAMFGALTTHHNLRKAYLRSDLSSDHSRVTLQEATVVRHFVRDMTDPSVLGRALTHLCVDERVLNRFSAQTLGQLKELEILKVTESLTLSDVLGACHLLESLTFHELEPYSDTPVAPGHQLEQGVRDAHVSVHDNTARRILHVLHDNPDYMPKLTSFKFAQHENIFPLMMCAALYANLELRSFHRLDLNLVIFGHEIARELLLVIGKMPNLTTLGITVREPYDPIGVSKYLLAWVPQTLRNFRYSVHGWRLYHKNAATRRARLTSIVESAVKELPELTFLHISDGVQRPMLKTSPDTFNWSPEKLGKLELLGIEFSYYDILRDPIQQKTSVVPWNSRTGLWNMYEAERMDEDARWLMRYHRDSSSN